MRFSIKTWNRINGCGFLITLLALVLLLRVCHNNGRKCSSFSWNPGLSVAELEKQFVLDQPTNAYEVDFVVVNNPFCLKPDDRIVIYMDRWCVYSGAFTRGGLLKVPDELVALGSAHVVFYVIRGDSVRNFQNKSIIPWLRSFNYLYICFFPTNDLSDCIHFFPQEEKCIQ